MTHEEKVLVREQLLAFVERVSGADTTNKTPEEVNALPAVLSILITEL